MQIIKGQEIALPENSWENMGCKRMKSVMCSHLFF